MEIHKELSPEIEKFRPDLNGTPRAYFKKAFEFTKTFYNEVMTHIWDTSFDKVTPEFFYREFIWVVHATGFSAKAVGKFMPKLLEAYGDWKSLASEGNEFFSRVKPVCNNPQKARAIWSVASLMNKGINAFGWEKWKLENLNTPEKLSKLPYIGKVTCYHLGRNIGLLECVKPDLHLVRMVEHWGFADCEEMCKSMRDSDEVPLGIVDLCLWYAASTFGTLEVKKKGSR